MACLPNHLSNCIVIQSRHWILITIIYPRFRWGPSIAKYGPIITWWMNEWVKWISFSKMDSNLKRRQGKYWWSCHWAQSSRWSHYIRGDLVLHHGNLSQSDSKCSGVLSNFCCLRPISLPCFRHSCCRHSCLRFLNHHRQLFSFV